PTFAIFAMTNPFRRKAPEFQYRGGFSRNRRGNKIRGLRMTIRRDRRPRSGYGDGRKPARRSSWQRHIRRWWGSSMASAGFGAQCDVKGAASICPTQFSPSESGFISAQNFELLLQPVRLIDRHAFRVRQHGTARCTKTVDRESLLPIFINRGRNRDR